MNDQNTDYEYQGRKDAIENIITLHGFIMVLAIGNAIRGYVEPKLSNASELHLFSRLDEHFFSFLITLLFVIRFFLGDRTYLKNYDPKIKRIYILDMINIIISSIIIAYASFLVRVPDYLFQIIFILMIFELAWFFVRSRMKELVYPKRGRNIPGQRNASIYWSTIVSFFTIMTIAICIIDQSRSYDVKFEDSASVFWHYVYAVAYAWKNVFSGEWTFTLAIIFFANCFADIVLRYNSYFGGEDAIIRIALHNKKDDYL